MKAYFWIPFAVLAGALVGSWGPRAEVRALQAQSKEAKSQPRNVATEGFKAFAGLANIPDEARRPRRRNRGQPLFVSASNRVDRTRKAAASHSPAVTNTPPVAATNAPSAAATNAPAWKPMSPEDLRARIEEAQEIWRTRVEVARTSWKSKLKLTGDAAGKFDAALDEMNVKLYDTMQTMAQLVAEKDKVSPELGLRLIGDATTVMAETYEKVGSFVPPEMRDRVSDMPMTDFIDPGVGEPLIAVQDKLEDSFRGVTHR